MYIENALIKSVSLTPLEDHTMWEACMKFSTILQEIPEDLPPAFRETLADYRKSAGMRKTVKKISLKFEQAASWQVESEDKRFDVQAGSLAITEASLIAVGDDVDPRVFICVEGKLTWDATLDMGLFSELSSFTHFDIRHLPKEEQSAPVLELASA